MSDIIHYEDPEREGYYHCVWVHGIGKPEKLTHDPSKVTCKNCLNLISPNMDKLGKDTQEVN